MVKGSRSLDPLQISRDLLSLKVTEALRHKIIAGHIPDGERLVEDDLARCLGVSRAPVREALAILERERLVRSTPGKGTYVRALTEDSVRQLFAVRTLLESYAAELAAEHVAAEPTLAEELLTLADEFGQATAEGRTSELAKLDINLHQKIWSLSGNEHLIDVLQYLATMVRVILSLDVEKTANWREIAPKTHRRLIESVASGDPKVARDWVNEDATAQLQSAISALRSSQESVRDSAAKNRSTES